MANTPYREADTSYLRSHPILREAPILPKADTAKPILTLCVQLTEAMKRPTRRTLRLLDRALDWLRPFESPSARTASPAERQDLLDLLTTHRLLLSPYLNLDRIETHLRTTMEGRLHSRP